jgi:hypothetical protein
VGVEGVLDALADARVPVKLRRGHGWLAGWLLTRVTVLPLRVPGAGEEGGAELPNFL